jgi:monoamine oxidase
LIHELKKLKRDTTLSDFLRQKFPADRHPELHRSIKKFVEGYNAADITQVSVCALREEWSRVS